MATNTQLLAAHPSVQDLGIQYGGINLAKTSLHRMLINSKPLHEMSDSDYAAATHKHRKGGRANEPKDAKVTVVKNSCAGFNGLSPADNGSGSLPAIAAGGGGRPGTGTGGGGGGRSFSVTNTRTNAKEAMMTSPTRGGVLGKSSFNTSAKVVTQLPPRKNPSLVSSAFSYSADGCSDCGSFSMYSCSCCHVKAPSSVASTATSIPSSSVASDPMKRRKIGTTYYVPKTANVKGSRLSALALQRAGSAGADGGSTVGRPHGDDEDVDLDQYENLTSVSQRCSNASVTSSQIASLKQELESERRTRLQTQIELQKIRERQQMLLDRLASKEHSNMTADDKYTIKRMLREVNQQLNAMGVATTGLGGSEAKRGSAVGAPVDASDSVMQ